MESTMRNKREIKLDAPERKELERYTKTGNRSAKLASRARVILELDQGDEGPACTQEEAAQRAGVSRQTVNVAKRGYLAAPSVEAFLRRKKRANPPVAPKVTGEVEARIVAVACSAPPTGRCRWTLELIAGRCVQLRYVDSLSAMTVQRLLKKRNCAPTSRRSGASRPGATPRS